MKYAMKYFYLAAALTVAFAPYEAFATVHEMETSEPLPDIEDHLPSEQHTLRGEARSLQISPALICGVNKVWICRGMYTDTCVVNSARLSTYLARTNSLLGKCPCSTERADTDCCNDFHCGDVAFFKCNDSTRKCDPLPCNATTQTGVDCCEDSECLDLDRKKCNSSKKCENLPCVLQTIAGTGCCVDSDCASNQCFENVCAGGQFCTQGLPDSPECCFSTDCPANNDCVLNECLPRNCNINRPDIQCCVDSHCNRGVGESCSSSVCILEGDPRVTLTWFGDDELDLVYVTPNGDEITWNRQFDARTGGRLDRDASGGTGTAGLKVENIHFPSPPVGVSRVMVRNFASYGFGPDPWTVEIHLGTYVVTYTGQTESGTSSSEFRFRFGGP